MFWVFFFLRLLLWIIEWLVTTNNKKLANHVQAYLEEAVSVGRAHGRFAEKDEGYERRVVNDEYVRRKIGEPGPDED